MPLIIKRNVLKVKAPGSSTYRGIDAVTDETAAQKVAQINAAGAAQIQAVEDKGDEVVGSLRESIVSASATAVAPSEGVAASYDNQTGALNLSVPRGPGPVSISDGVDQPDGRTKYTLTFEGVGSAAGASFDFFVRNGTTLDRVYPVGAIYISTVATSPRQLFGFGTWERITDCFLLAAGTTKHTAGSTGGSESQEIDFSEDGYAQIGFTDNDTTHISLSRRNPTAEQGKYTPTPFTVGNSASLSFGNPSVEEADAVALGGTTTVSTMPPYLAVYVWKRTE